MALAMEQKDYMRAVTKGKGSNVVCVGLVRVAHQMNGLHIDINDVREKLLLEFKNSPFGNLGEAEDEKAGQTSKWQLAQEIDRLMSQIEADGQTMRFIRNKLAKADLLLQTKNVKLESLEDEKEKFRTAREQLATHLSEVDNREWKQRCHQAKLDDEMRQREEDASQLLKETDERLTADVHAERKLLIEEKKICKQLRAEIELWENQASDGRKAVQEIVRQMKIIKDQEAAIEEFKIRAEEQDKEIEKFRGLYDVLKLELREAIERGTMTMEEIPNYKMMIIQLREDYYNLQVAHAKELADKEAQIKILEEYMERKKREEEMLSLDLQASRNMFLNLMEKFNERGKEIDDLNELARLKELEAQRQDDLRKEQIAALESKYNDVYDRLTNVDLMLPFVSPAMEALPKLPTDLEQENAVYCSRCRDSITFLYPGIRIPNVPPMGKKREEKIEETGGHDFDELQKVIVDMQNADLLDPSKAMLDFERLYPLETHDRDLHPVALFSPGLLEMKKIYANLKKKRRKGKHRALTSMKHHVTSGNFGHRASSASPTTERTHRKRRKPHLRPASRDRLSTPSDVFLRSHRALSASRPPLPRTYRKASRSPARSASPVPAQDVKRDAHGFERLLIFNSEDMRSKFYSARAAEERKKTGNFPHIQKALPNTLDVDSHVSTASMLYNAAVESEAQIAEREGRPINSRPWSSREGDRNYYGELQNALRAQSQSPMGIRVEDWRTRELRHSTGRVSDLSTGISRSPSPTAGRHGRGENTSTGSGSPLPPVKTRNIVWR